MSLSNEPFVILGAFRSGTSCLATALTKLGVHLGAEKDFHPADQFNERGYQELVDLQKLNAYCLAVFGINYFQAEPLPNDWRHHPSADALVCEIASCLRRHFAGEKRWGWKEPSTTVLLPLYMDALARESVTSPRFPISIRHPLSVAASQQRRQAKHGFDEPEFLFPTSDAPPIEQRTVGLWMHYTLSALRETKGFTRLVFSYEDFLANPKPYLDRLIDGLSGWKPSESELQAAASSVEPQLSHSTLSINDLASLPPIVARAYDCCLRAEANLDGLNSGKFDCEIDEIWEEWNYLSQMAKPIVPPYTDMYLNWKSGRTLVKFTASGSWQTVRGMVQANGGETVQIDPSKLPCQVWIKRAVWKTNSGERKAPLKQGINGILEDYGEIQRLFSYGPCPLITQTPDGDGPFELDMDLMVVTNYNALAEMVGKLRGRLDQASKPLALR